MSIDAIKQAFGATDVPITHYLLRVEGGTAANPITAGAVWNKGRCIEAAPILRWMLSKTPREARDALLRRGWSYTWHRTEPRSCWHCTYYPGRRAFCRRGRRNITPGGACASYQHRTAPPSKQGEP